MEIFKLFGSVFIDDNDASRGLENIDKKAEGTGSKLGSMIGTAAKVGIGIAAGVAAAGAGLFALASQASDTASEINDMSVRTGFSTDRLQELKFAAEQSGVGFGSIQSAVAKLTMNMGKATEEGKGMSLAFEQLGVKTTDASGAMLDTQTVFDQSLVKLSEMTNETERNALGMQIFGKGFVELSPLVDGGSASLAEMSAKAHELGLVMSEDAISAGDQFGDSLDAMKATLGGVVAKIGIELLPTFQKMMDWVMQHMPEIQATIGFVFQAIKTSIAFGIEWIGKLIDWVKKWLSENQTTVNKIKQGFMEFFTAVSEFIKAFITLAVQLWEKYGEDILNVVKSAWNLIAEVFKLAIKIIVDIFKIFAAAFRGDWSDVWSGIKTLFQDVWTGVGKILQKSVDYLIAILKLAWKVLADITESVFGGIGELISDTWDGIVAGIKGAINAIIRAINGMISGLNRIQVDIPAWVEKATGMSDFGLNISHIPLLAEGGNITAAGRVIVGERGPEYLDLPTGARVTPLDHDGGGYRTADITVQIDGRDLVRIVGQELVDLIKVKTGVRV